MILDRLAVLIALIVVTVSALSSSALAITVTSCDMNGVEKNEFGPDDDVYVNVTGLNPIGTYTIWIQNHLVNESDPIKVGEDPSGQMEILYANSSNDLPMINADGSIGPIRIWANISSDRPERMYDIVVDDSDFIYNSTTDGLDSVGAGEGGFMAPVPELPTIILTAIGLIGLIALGRRR